MEDKILTFAEAVKIYKLSDGSVFRHWVGRGKLREGVDCWKSGKVWLIKQSAIERILIRKE